MYLVELVIEEIINAVEFADSKEEQIANIKTVLSNNGIDLEKILLQEEQNETDI